MTDAPYLPGVRPPLDHDDAFVRSVRLVEALLFAAPAPVPDHAIRERLPDMADLAAILDRLAVDYRGRGVELVRVADGWTFRTAPDLADRLRLSVDQPRKLTRAGLETLAIVAYHQPVTRAEIEAIRGVSTSRGTLDALLEAGWVRPGRRRQTPGRPQTWVTTPAFLDHFTLGGLEDLPGVEEMKAAGLLTSDRQLTMLPGGTLPDLETGDLEGDDDGADRTMVPSNDPMPPEDLFEGDGDDPR